MQTSPQPSRGLQRMLEVLTPGHKILLSETMPVVPSVGRHEVNRPEIREALGDRGVSDGPLMDVTPALAMVMLQRDGHGMVGLLIVRLGVLVGGVVGAGHPAAGQAAPQPHPAAAAVKARQTLGRVWLDRAGAAEVVARPEVAPKLGCCWHRIPARPCCRGKGVPN
jgi:hypothetical protein